jgi:hypothetical protein
MNYSDNIKNRLKHFYGRFMQNTVTVFIVLLIFSFVSCKKYLDIIPDNVSTIDNAFKLRIEAEKFLYTCYSYLPLEGDPGYDPGFVGGDEIWYPPVIGLWPKAINIARGEQNRSDPLLNVWRGAQSGGGPSNLKPLWAGIRNCNIFLENLRDTSKVRDISLDERKRWIGEAEFLKAYYHYYLFRMYGPIPLIDKNISVEESSYENGQKRMPVDDCVNYIAEMLDTAAGKLPLKIFDENRELGRITRPIALAIRAELLLTAASPLFNGNPDFASFRDKDNAPLFNPTYDANKWVVARDAALKAITAAEAAGHQLYVYNENAKPISDITRQQLSIRNAVAKNFNVEHVWGLSNSYFGSSSRCMPRLVGIDKAETILRVYMSSIFSAPLKMAKMFYTKNGVPIDEDKTLDFSAPNQLRKGTAAEKYNIREGYITARLNFDREPRFYADLCFDGGNWYMNDSKNGDADTYYIQGKMGELAGASDVAYYNITGYFIKKLVNWESTIGNGFASWKAYPWPRMRLANLYLMYAEALNEAEPGNSTAIEYIDKVRQRAGLPGVVQSWTNFSRNPAKYQTQEGLREIIRRERSIELAFEGNRFWDLRRWKTAASELNTDITGWNVFSSAAPSYYQERVEYSRSFITPRDYFWPIGDYDTRRNPNLVENPGW